MFRGKTVSLIIPAGRPERRVQLEALISKLSSGTLTPDEVILVENTSPAGRARNIGAERAKGDILVFADDDIIIEQDDLLERVLLALFSDEEIGIVGVSQDIPPSACRFQRAYRRQFDRIASPVFDIISDSDMATTVFCAIRKADFLIAGTFDESLAAGEDNLLRYKIRQLGKRVVIAPKTRVFHAAPKNLRELIGRERWYGSARAILARRDDVPLGGIEIRTKPLAVLYLLAQTLLFPVRLIIGGPTGRGFGWWPLRAAAHWFNSLYYSLSVLKGGEL